MTMFDVLCQVDDSETYLSVWANNEGEALVIAEKKLWSEHPKSRRKVVSVRTVGRQPELNMDFAQGGDIDSSL